MERSTIHYLKQKGWTNSQIAKAVGCHRDTVRRILCEPVNYQPAPRQRESQVTVFAEAIQGWLAMQLRYRLPYGQAVRPEWISQWVYAPTVQLHLAVAVLWLVGFLLSAVYTPRRIVHWYAEYQRVFLAHTVASFCLARAIWASSLWRSLAIRPGLSWNLQTF